MNLSISKFLRVLMLLVIIAASNHCLVEVAFAFPCQSPNHACPIDGEKCVHGAPCDTLSRAGVKGAHIFQAPLVHEAGKVNVLKFVFAPPPTTQEVLSNVSHFQDISYIRFDGSALLDTLCLAPNAPPSLTSA